MRQIFSIIFLMVGAAMTHASTLTYSYTGPLIECVYDSEDGCRSGETELWTGTLDIDDTAVPASLLAGNMLRAIQQIPFETQFPFLWSVEILPAGSGFVDMTAEALWSATSAAMPMTRARTARSAPAPMQTLVTATGDLRQFLDGGVGYTAFGLTFGHDLAILDWNGECYCGGSNDPHTSASHGDGRNGMGLYSFGSGTWTMEGQVEDPLHAPLPSSGVLLLGGLGVALAAPWLRRVRRRQH